MKKPPKSPEEALERIGAAIDRAAKSTKKAKASLKRIEDLNRKERRILKKILD
jgi:FixJ family two-component response regulator